MNGLADKREQDSVAALDHQTGPARGTISWLKGPTLDVFLGGDRQMRVNAPLPGGLSDGVVARLHRVEGGYQIEAVAGGPTIWVNRREIASQILKHGDMVEFGESGPLSRFQLYQRSRPFRRTFTEILGDGFAYLRNSRRPLVGRLWWFCVGLARRLASETTLLFRLGVVGAIASLAVITYQQNRVNTLLRQQLERDSSRLDSVSRTLAQARKEALTPGDLVQLGDEMASRIRGHADRLKALENLSQASNRVISQSLPAVVFLQGSFHYRETVTKRLLRHVVGPEGNPLLSPYGEPLLTVEGNGPIAESQYTGTAFAAARQDILITNRHVALPWEKDGGTTALKEQGFQPEMNKLIFYRPGGPGAGEIELVRVSDKADLAVLRTAKGKGPERFLELAPSPSATGDEVFVMGYPTGLRSMLAQSGTAFIEELEKSGDTDFWSVAAKLDEKGLIAPLASRGIVAHVTAATVVYDAETTHGGSGGPVLDIDGRVIAVTSAILPEYGGSNLGVPVAEVRRLMQKAGVIPSPAN